MQVTGQWGTGEAHITFVDSCLNISAVSHHLLNNSKYIALEETASLGFCMSEEEQALANQNEDDYMLTTTFSLHSATAVAKFNINGHLSKQEFNH